MILGVYSAVLTINEGNISKSQVLQKLGTFGIKYGKVMKTINLQRILKADTGVDELMKKVRQSIRNVKRKLEGEMDIHEDCLLYTSRCV